MPTTSFRGDAVLDTHPASRTKHVGDLETHTWWQDAMMNGNMFDSLSDLPLTQTDPFAPGNRMHH